MSRTGCPATKKAASWSERRSGDVLSAVLHLAPRRARLRSDALRGVSEGLARMGAELVAKDVRMGCVAETKKAKAGRELVSFNTRRIVALVVMLLGSTFGGLLAVAFTDSRLAAIVGVVLGAVAGMVFILIWANRSV